MTPVRIAAALARAWVRLYTRPVEPEFRAIRREEISSDLWEHEQASARRGEHPLVTAAHILWRVGIGAFDDLRWSLETRPPSRRASPREGRVDMSQSVRSARVSVVLGFTGAAMAILMFVVTPMLMSRFAAAGVPLPLPTRLVLAVFALLKSYWWVWVPAVALLLWTRFVPPSTAHLRHDGADGAAQLGRIKPAAVVGVVVLIAGMTAALFMPMLDIIRAGR